MNYRSAGSCPAACTHYGRDKIPRVSLASPSVKNRALGEDRHSAKKHVTWRFTPPTPLKLKKTKILPRVPGKALGEEFLFFFCFFTSFFCEAFPHYLKLSVQIWDNFDFFCYISLDFFRFIEFFCILRIWTAGAWNNRIWWFTKLY